MWGAGERRQVSRREGWPEGGVEAGGLAQRMGPGGPGGLAQGPPYSSDEAWAGSTGVGRWEHQRQDL